MDARNDALEIVAQFDGSILDVKHLVQRSDELRLRERRARALVAGGGAALGLALSAFALSCTHVTLPRAIDFVAAALLGVGVWLLLRGLSQLAERPRHAYTVGDDARADLPLPLPRVVLAEARDGGFDLALTAAMTGELTVDGKSLPVAIARAGGAHSIALPPEGRATLELGHARFTIARVAAPSQNVGARSIDWGRELYTGGVALVVSAFLFLLYSVPPDPQSLALDQDRQHAIAHFMIVPPDPPPPPPMPGVQPHDQSTGGRGSAPASGRSGDIGRLMAPHAHAQLKFKGNKDETRRLAGAAAQNAGILPLIGGSQIGSVFGNESPLGADKETILGDLRGEQTSDVYGHGLDLVGRGDGPGANGRGQTIGVGKLNTIGDCPTCGDGRNRYGSRLPSAQMVHHAKAPDIIPGLAEVKCGVNGACLDKEIVKRVIHHHKPEVRFCYERQLMSHDGLNGRVVTQFTIAPTGRVLASFVTESSLHDRQVEQCIVEALRRWEFPQSMQTSVVTYPFILQSAGK